MHLYLGGPHPFDSPPVITWENHGSPTGLHSFSPRAIGDIDCDGVTDFMTVFGNFPKSDTLRLFTGLETLSYDEYLTFLPNSQDDWYPVIAGGGDNNNDGRPDFWINNLEGGDSTIWGYSGCDLLDTIPDFKIILSRNPDLKYRYINSNFCNTCDLNGDSIPDIVFGQATSYYDYPGRVGIVWGKETLSESPDLTFYAPLPHGGNNAFGRDLDCLGDISGDGIDDLWVSQGGRNYIFYGGRPFDTIPDVALDWSYMYANMENVGDVNNDGWNDVILVDDSYLINRVSYIYGGPDMDTLVDVVYSDFDFYAATHQGSVCCVGIDHSWAGDINGDGIDDILISGRTDDVDANDQGFLFIQAGWDSIPTDVSDDTPPVIPSTLDLKQNYPNPFNPGTTIEFTLSRAGYTEIRVYNLLGEVVAIPMKGFLTAGSHQVTWDGLGLDGKPAASGIYFYRLTSGSYSDTRKMILMK
ncbi:MAG: T9SS type A sorting domain-containing protein [candidate division Zixibacteria bacterium]|nr:T9SS type A sorting domain-containing protein [candidate division Zixibacteria bacterium]